MICLKNKPSRHFQANHGSHRIHRELFWLKHEPSKCLNKYVHYFPLNYTPMKQFLSDVTFLRAVLQGRAMYGTMSATKAYNLCVFGCLILSAYLRSDFFLRWCLSSLRRSCLCLFFDECRCPSSSSEAEESSFLLCLCDDLSLLFFLL